MLKFLMAVPLALAFFVTPVMAQMPRQPVCLPHEHVIDHLAQKYGESRLGVGISGEAGLVEIWASEATGSWTLLLTRPNGLSCVIGTGENWQSESAKAPIKGDPA